jgi:hypothetical protein
MTFLSKTIPLFFLLALIFSGCGQIPKAAVDANEKVTQGIEAQEENGLTLVQAWEDTSYYLLDEKWDMVYDKAEKTFRDKRGISADSTLTSDQYKSVAGLAVLIRDEVRHKIRTRADEMRENIRKNARQTTEINSSVSDLLVSANSVTKNNVTLLKDVEGFVPISAEIQNFLDEAFSSIK